MADERSDEKEVPHKLTPFEESKAIHTDIAIASVPQTSEQQPGGSRERIEPRPPELDKIDTWPT